MVRINLVFCSENLHCLVHLSLPSVVLAEASWYGSLRSGWESNGAGQAGVVDNGSRWGIKGSSEVSEGLSAVYQFETKIDSSNASNSVGAAGGRLSYVGLSGGFGTLTIGQVWSAAYNNIGGIIDTPHKYGTSGIVGDALYRIDSAISYAVSVGSVSLQADIQGKQGSGKSKMDEDKDIDASNFGATVAIGENGKIAIGHANFDVPDKQRTKKTSIAAAYNVGGMTLSLGHGVKKHKNSAAANAETAEENVKNNYFGVAGGVGDTGISFVFQAHSTKGDTKTGAGAKTSMKKMSPWVFGLSRSLGGGASVHFEHKNPDNDTDGEDKSSNYFGLMVNF